MIRKIISWALITLGSILTSSALLLGFAAVAGGYYPKPFHGLIGHLAAMFTVALFQDWSVALIFWFGLIFLVSGVIASVGVRR